MYSHHRYISKETIQMNKIVKKHKKKEWNFFPIFKNHHDYLWNKL